MKHLLFFTVLSMISILSFAQTSREEFYDGLNKIRKNRFLKELQVDTLLEKESEAWIIKTKGKLWHDRSTLHGEVLARSYDPLSGWMHSKGHKKTMLRRKYRFVGYAFVMIDGLPFACARFR